MRKEATLTAVTLAYGALLGWLCATGALTTGFAQENASGPARVPTFSGDGSHFEEVK
jgi:hypothetical protein